MVNLTLYSSAGEMLAVKHSNAAQHNRCDRYGMDEDASSTCTALLL